MPRYLTILAVLFATTLSIGQSAWAHHPERPRTAYTYHRFEPIPPLHNPWYSYRARYNRPTNIGGRLAYIVAPSSQEAMSWHRNQHAGMYDSTHHQKKPALRPKYYYPKPWEVLHTGPRTPVNSKPSETAGY